MAERLQTRPRFQVQLTYRIEAYVSDNRYISETVADGSVTLDLERLSARETENILTGLATALNGAYDRAEENTVTLATNRLAAESASPEDALA